MENRNLKISFNKSGSGSYTPRLSLPITWIREMGISQEDREVVVSLCEDFIMVRKKDFNFSADTIEDRSENKKVSFNKSGSGSINSRVILPMSFIKHLNINTEDKNVIVTFENNIIKIKKA